MKNKLSALLCIVLILSIASTTVFAADALYRMLHAEEVEQFRADQDAIVVGQITQNKQNTFTVKVLKVISGKVSGDTILVDNSLTYMGFGEPDNKPLINDYCVLSLKKFEGYYKRAWYTVKADSGDYRTLKLIYKDKLGDIPAIQWYINSGGKDKDFSFDRDAIYVKRANGERVRINPIEEEKIEEPIQTETVAKAPITDGKKAGTVQTESASTLVICTAGLVIILAIIVLLKRGKGKRGQK